MQRNLQEQQDAAPQTDEPAAASPMRSFAGPLAIGVAVFAAGLSALHLYWGVVAPANQLVRNAVHFALFAFLAAVLAPVVQGGRIGRWARESPVAFAIDVALGIAVAASAIHLALAETEYYRTSEFTTIDWIAGAVLILGALELTRRTSGPVIPVLAIIAVTYLAVWGPFAPEPFDFRGLSAKTVLAAMVYEDEGMFGTLARISSGFVFLFIIFGAFLVRSGAGEFVIALARSVAGRTTGGPGLIAVIASALTGTISGSAIANTASTGVVTIPMMRRAGFNRAFAGGVEAASSTGGQLAPPIMGAGAFAMASYTQQPYGDIVAIAILPAILYFATVAMFVRIRAKRLGLVPIEDPEAPTLGQAMRDGGASFLGPIAVVIGMLVAGFSPAYAAVTGIVSVIAFSWLTRNPMGQVAIFEALALGARNMVMMAVLLCTVALVVNAIVKAGVGNTFSLFVGEWADGNLLIAIVLVAIASLILGLGLPVTAAYIVLATLSAPLIQGLILDPVVVNALASGALDPAVQATVMLAAPEAAASLALGLDAGQAATLYAGLPFEIQAVLRDAVVSDEARITALLAAHMIIFYLSQDSNVTPPVALAAFTAAAIAKTSAMRTSVESWKIAKGLYVAPVLFAYTPLLSQDWTAAMPVFLCALVGVYGLAGALEGWLETRLNPVLRALAALGGLAALWPAALVPGGPMANLAGVAVVLAVFAVGAVGRRAADPQRSENSG